MGRKSTFSDEIANTIVESLTAGIPLAEICRRESIGVSTVYDWMDAHEEFAGRIARARVFGHDQIAVDTRRVSRGEEGFSSGDVQRDKLIVDTDLKLLAKWDPKRYGDRQTVEHEGSVNVRQFLLDSE